VHFLNLLYPTFASFRDKVCDNEHYSAQTKQAGLVVTLWSRIRELQGSTLDWDAVCPHWGSRGTPQHFRENYRTVTTDWVTAILLLVLASTVILGPESHGTHARVLLSENRQSLWVYTRTTWLRWWIGRDQEGSSRGLMDVRTFPVFAWKHWGKSLKASE
jgi:hypothetical protein